MAQPYRTECASCAKEDKKTGNKLFHKVVRMPQDCLPSAKTPGAAIVKCDACGAPYDHRPKRVLANVVVSGDEENGVIGLTSAEGEVVGVIKLAGGTDVDGNRAGREIDQAFFVERLDEKPYGKGYLRRERLKLAFTRHFHFSTVRDLVVALHLEGARWQADEAWLEKQKKVDSAIEIAVVNMVESGAFTREEAVEAVSIKLKAVEIPWPTWLVGEHQPTDALADEVGNDEGEEEAAA